MRRIGLKLHELELHKTVKNACFVLFFSIEGIVAKIVIPKGTTVTGNLYANKILPEVFSKFREMSERSTVQDVMLHHDTYLKSCY